MLSAALKPACPPAVFADGQLALPGLTPADVAEIEQRRPEPLGCLRLMLNGGREATEHERELVAGICDAVQALARGNEETLGIDEGGRAVLDGLQLWYLRMGDCDGLQIEIAPAAGGPPLFNYFGPMFYPETIPAIARSWNYTMDVRCRIDLHVLYECLQGYARSE